jgi:hypothetical protein
MTKNIIILILSILVLFHICVHIYDNYNPDIKIGQIWIYKDDPFAKEKEYIIVDYRDDYIKFMNLKDSTYESHKNWIFDYMKPKCICK